MRKKIEAIVKKFIPKTIDAEVTIPEQDSFGHYSTSAAMRWAKEEGKDPMVLARRLVPEINRLAPKKLFSRVEAVKPGFLNFWISPETFQKEFEGMLTRGGEYGRSAANKGKTVIVEFSSPNIAKPMHVGHLRSTIIGDSLAHMYEFLGYKVIRLNYLGDWGTQFGNLIAAYRIVGKEKFTTVSVKKMNLVRALADLYVEFHERAKKYPYLLKKGQEEFQKLEKGDEKNKRLWQWFKKASLREFDRTYRDLGIAFDKVIGESSHEKNLKALIAHMEKKGIARESEGAVVVPLDAFKLPTTIIRKSDGASVYLTREIASLEWRTKRYKPSKIIYVVANQQSLHFEQLFAIAKLLKLDRPELVHVKFGLVLGEDKKKLATREGNVIPLEDVLSKVRKLAYDVVSKKNPKLSPRMKTKVAHAVGIGAIKYNDLKENRNSDIVFDWKKMLDFSGNSAPYLQYTYARLAGIQRKAGRLGKANASRLGTEIEIALIKHLLEFSGIVEKSAATHFTNGLADYLYKLATFANQFYETTPILKDFDIERRNARRQLLKVVGAVLEQGLGLLGIQTLKEI